MSKINFVLDESLHMAIKIFCAKEKMSITSYIIMLIKADLLKRGEIGKS